MHKGNMRAKTPRLLLLMILMTQSLHAGEAPFSCHYHYANSDWINALDSCRRAAEGGDARSQTYLGELYDQGLGVSRNPQKAARWWQEAAQQQDIQAQNLLALKYYYGGDVFGPQPGWQQNYKKSYELWSQGALQGIAGAQFMLGVMNMQGQGVEKDYSESYAWFNLALKGGYELATDTLIELSRLISPQQKTAGKLRQQQLQAIIKAQAP